MTKTVGFAWWTPAHGGSQQAFVNNYNGIKRAGMNPSAFVDRSMESMVSSADSFDIAFVPFVFDPGWIEYLSRKTHVHLQIGGYGRNDWDAAEDAMAAADTVSVLDPQLAEAFGAPDARWIPNPPNSHMFPRYDRNKDGYVLIPKSHESGGLGPIRGAVQESDEEFVALGSMDHPPDNVRVRPPVPLSWMPEMYEGAKAVLNPKEEEGLPNVAYEAFLTGRPYIAPHSGAVGDSQAAASPPVDQIGTPCDRLDPWRPGHHYGTGLDEITRGLASSGRNWVDEWCESGWDWASKIEAIATIVEGVD